MSSTVPVKSEILYKLCEDFFKREDEKRKRETKEYRKRFYTERTWFGLMPPKYTKEEVDSWEDYGIYDSMKFQTMWPHHQLYALKTAAQIAMKADVDIIDVDASLFAELK